MAARITNLLDRRGEDVFVPLAFGLSRRMEQAEWADYVDDPAFAAFALTAAKKTLLADGFVNWFDDWLEAESAGIACVRDEAGRGREAPGSAKTPALAGLFNHAPAKSALDVASRLCRQTSDQEVVLGYVTGPATLMSRLFGANPPEAAPSSVGDTILAMAKVYFEAGVSALLLADGDDSDRIDLAEALRPLLNLASYYEIPVLYLARRGAGALVGRLEQLGARIVAKDGRGPIVCLPIGEMPPDECLAIWRGTRSGGRRLVLSSWDISFDSAPEDVLSIARQIKGQ